MPRPKRDIPEFKLRKFKDKKNFYVCWSEDRRSKRVSTGTGDPAKAQQFLAEFIAGWNTAPASSEPTVGEAIAAYLEFKKEQYKQNEQPEKYYDTLEYSLDPVRREMGFMPISNILRHHSREYVKRQLGLKLSTATVRRQLDIFIAALNFVHREGWISSVPHIEKPPAPPPRDVWMTPEQAKTFLSHCTTPHIRLFALLAFHTLSRKRAMLDLKWDQVDLDNRLIDFNPPGRLRTKKRRVPVTINKTLLAALQEAREMALTEYVVEYNGKSVGNVIKAFQRVSDRAGMPWVTPHVLRHTGATLLAQKGVSMWEIAGIMGDRIATVEQHYAKHHPDYLKNAVSALEDLYS